MPYFTVTIERTAWQELEICEIEAPNEDDAITIADSEYRKHARRPQVIAELVEIDSDYRVIGVRRTAMATDDE
jgi:hypothetical protein